MTESITTTLRALLGTEYIVLCGSIVGGGVEASFEAVYSFDGKRFAGHQHAIAHGFKIRGSDDFNIGVLEDGRLVCIKWMDQVVDDDDDVMRDISQQIGITP